MTFVIVLLCASFQCWLVSCGCVNVYKFLFYEIVLIWGKTNKDVLVLVAWMAPKKPHYKRKQEILSLKKKKLCAIYNEKHHSLLMLGSINYDLWNSFISNITL